MGRKLTGATPSDAGDVMTVDQVAAYLQLNRLTVYRYVREGKIPASKIGKLYRILRADVDRFLQTQKVEASPAIVPSARPTPSRQPQTRLPAGPGTTVRAEVRPRFYSDDLSNVPPRLERTKAVDQTALDGGYAFEWIMRGLH